MTNEKLRIVIFQKRGHWLAQCLDYDISARGKTLKEAQDSLAIAIQCHLGESIEHTGKAFGGIDSAPEVFQRRRQPKSVTRVQLDED